MSIRHNMLYWCKLAVWVVACLPYALHAQLTTLEREPLNREFSYSIVSGASDIRDALQQLQQDVLPVIEQRGARVFAIWLPATKPDDAPFAGLEDTQFGLMLAWPIDAQQQVGWLDSTLQSIDPNSTVESRIFEPLFLASGLAVPAAAGFYVHREEHYAPDDVSEAVRLSREAWQTWEPAYGVRVVGLFREVPMADDFVNLNRIVWYPSYEVWLDTRNFEQDPESARRFRDRRQLLIEGSGIAIATDRAEHN